MAVEAELKRRNNAAALVDWLLATDADNPATGLSDPVVDFGLRTKLEQVRALLAAPLSVTGPMTDTQLRAADVDVRDDYATEAHAVDQVGTGTVLTFAVAEGHMVMVDVDAEEADDTLNYRARATCDSSTPTATSGFVCRPGTTYLPIPTAGTVKVWAPTGTVVAVQVLSR